MSAGGQSGHITFKLGFTLRPRGKLSNVFHHLPVKPKFDENSLLNFHEIFRKRHNTYENYF